MTPTEEQSIIRARRDFALKFGSRCPDEHLDRALGILAICRTRPRVAPYVTILSAAWPFVYEPLLRGES